MVESFLGSYRHVLMSLAFLLLNFVVLGMVLLANRRRSTRGEAPSAVSAAADRRLTPSDILGWEFHYAQTTASEAMRDRHTMINFYLLVAGVVASGVVALLARGTPDSSLPAWSGTVLLWLLCGVGWFYFLKIIRLREAWHDSALAMNQIKRFYLEHSDHYGPETLGAAFRWKQDTLPPKEKLWTVFFYSAMLIAYLDSAAYVMGAMLLDLSAARSVPVVVTLVLFGLAFFGYHARLYIAFLKPT